MENTSASNHVTEKKQNKYDSKLIIISSLILLILLILTPALYFYYQYQQTKSLVNSLPQTYLDSPNAIINKVGQLIQLPFGETPQVVKITDANRAKQQPFLWKTKNGDILLLYQKAKLAILYDPVGDKVIQVGPLVFPTGEATSQAKLK